MISKGYKGIINITDTYINENVSIQLPQSKITIQNRDIYRGGRTEYYYNYCKFDNKLLKRIRLYKLIPIYDVIELTITWSCCWVRYGV